MTDTYHITLKKGARVLLEVRFHAATIFEAHSKARELRDALLRHQPKVRLFEANPPIEIVTRTIHGELTS